MPRRNSGMTLISFLILLAVGGFALVMVLRLMPTYSYFHSIGKSMRTVSKQEAENNLEGYGLREAFFAQLKQDQVEGVRSNDVKMKRVDGGWELQVNLERRSKLIGNLQVIGKFNRTQFVGRKEQ